MQGATVSDDPSTLSHTLAAGCVRQRCDEPGGYTCEPRYDCAPSETENPAGCVPAPCTETGLCADDVNFTCPAPGAASDPPGDEFGCVLKRCGDEGYVCGARFESLTGYVNASLPQICDDSNPNADHDGCVAPACDAPGGGCPDGFICDPTSDAEKTSTGCRSALCPNEFVCPTTGRCEQGARSADIHGCASDATPEPSGCSSG